MLWTSSAITVGYTRMATLNLWLRRSGNILWCLWGLHSQPRRSSSHCVQTWISLVWMTYQADGRNHCKHVVPGSWTILSYLFLVAPQAPQTFPTNQMLQSCSHVLVILNCCLLVSGSCSRSWLVNNESLMNTPERNIICLHKSTIANHGNYLHGLP